MAQELQQADAGSWWSWVTNYDQTLADFTAQYQQLLNSASYVQSSHPELVSAYNDLVSRAQSAIQKLNELKATRDYVYSWLDWLGSGAQQGVNFVSSAAQSTYDYLKSALGLSGLGGLGIAPVAVIGIAAAAAALVVIGYWVKDAIAFNQRVAALQQQEQTLINAGVPVQQAVQQAANLVNNSLGPAPGSAAAINSNLLGIPWTYLVWGAIAIFLGPPLIEALIGGKKEKPA